MIKWHKDVPCHIWTSFQGTEAWVDKNGNKYPSEWWKNKEK